MAQVDEAAVRTTRDVDILVRPRDLPALRTAMEAAGFHHRFTSGVHMIVESPDASARDAERIVLTGEMVRADDVEPNPDIEPTEIADNFRTLSLETLVRMKLSSNRDKDRVQVRDMISLGLMDATWPARFPAELGRRLQQLPDDPKG